MRIIHCADLHLDSKMETNFTPEQAQVRRQEILLTFEKMVDYALNNKIKIIMISGDMFDTSQNKQKRIKNRVMDKIRFAKDIDFLYLQGNHDKDEYFKQMEDKPDNLKLFSDKWSVYRYGHIVIYGKEFSEKNETDFYSGLMLNENDFNIVMLHGQLSACIQQKKGDLINLNMLKDKYIDYLALGHIHSYTKGVIDYRGHYVYSGCLEGRGFDEAGKKGFVVLDVDEDSYNQQFISMAERTFYELELDLTLVEDSYVLKKKLDSIIEDINEKDIVKLVLTGEVEEEFDIDIEYLTHYLNDKFFFAKVKDKTRLKIDYMKYEHDVSLKGEFIRLLQNEDIDEEKKETIIKLGIQAMTGGYSL